MGLWDVLTKSKAERMAEMQAQQRKTPQVAPAQPAAAPPKMQVAPVRRSGMGAMINRHADIDAAVKRAVK